MTGPTRELSRFCAELPSLRAALADSPDRGGLLESAVEAVRNGEPIAGFLRQLGISVPDSVSDGHPYDEGTDRGSPTPSLPWSTGGGYTVDGRYGCPLRVCGRQDRREPGDSLPMCHIARQPLIFDSGR